ncbi:hypothetical protein HUG17_4751 [Dermatophagoides farinae]|uniref:DUF4817 domain-containing protein n=1 Tax=Dermatophagoides farinae TaxID=6954 RepID=A0A9D4SHD7_DERFA|nr:hypothetical protein HUG17_4751 [Dermatophagoides farinae]
MSKYTLEQRQKIVEIYHEHKSFAKTRQICRQLFGDEMVPNYLTIKRYLEKLDEYGHLENLKQWCYVRIGRKHIVKAEHVIKSTNFIKNLPSFQIGLNQINIFTRLCQL